jgi:hypothetical protein
MTEKSRENEGKMRKWDAGLGAREVGSCGGGGAVAALEPEGVDAGHWP